MKRHLLLAALLLTSLFIHAQTTMGNNYLLAPRIGVGYGAQVEKFGMAAVSIGVEGASSKHWSLAADVHFGKLSNDYYKSTLVDRKMFGLSGDVNFYFKKAVQGVYLSGGGFYYGYNMDPSEGSTSIPPALRREDAAGLGLGLGYSQQLGDFQLKAYTKLGFNFIDAANSMVSFGLNLGYFL